jgi:hypothetical protein
MRVLGALVLVLFVSASAGAHAQPRTQAITLRSITAAPSVPPSIVAAARVALEELIRARPHHRLVPWSPVLGGAVYVLDATVDLDRQPRVVVGRALIRMTYSHAARASHDYAGAVRVAGIGDRVDAEAARAAVRVAWTHAVGAVR